MAGHEIRSSGFHSSEKVTANKIEFNRQMNFLSKSNLKFTTWLTIIFYGALVGYVYVMLVYTPMGNNVSPWLGVSIGIGIATVTSGFELFFVSNPNSLFRKLAFIPLLLVRVFVHAVLILSTIILCQLVYDEIYGTSIVDFDNGLSGYTTDLGFSLFVAALVLFYMQMRLFIGGRTLKNIILGKYNSPKSENRIFMFVDVIGSTAAAQEIGDINFHKYLNRLFTLFDEPIVRLGGEVHSYVGDAIIVTWPLSSNPVKNARALLTAREIVELCRENAASISKQFGVKPEVRLAINGGPIVAGETGFSKRQITYLGDTINITSRIESLSKELGKDYLISTSLLDSMTMPPNIQAHPLGEFPMKGVRHKMAISNLEFSL